MHHNYQAIINMFGGLPPLCVSFEPDQHHCIYDLKTRLCELTAIAMDCQRITTMGGRVMADEQEIFPDACGPIVYNLSLRLQGGRSGIGSTLHAQGGCTTVQKAVQFDTSNDLQGQQVRLANEAGKSGAGLAHFIEHAPCQRAPLDDTLRWRGAPVHPFSGYPLSPERDPMMDIVDNVVAHVIKRQKMNPMAAAVSLFDSEGSGDEYDSKNMMVPKKKDKGKGRAVEFSRAGRNTLKRKTMAD